MNARKGFVFSLIAISFMMLLILMAVTMANEYRENELQEWVSKIKVMGGLTKKFFVLFNNHPNAYAVKNAAMMAKLLEIDLPQIPMPEDYDDSLNKFL